jgi:hypothetical protein
MNLTAADIDRIVAEVVRRLRAMTAGSSNDQGRESLVKSDSTNSNDVTRQRLPTPSVWRSTSVGDLQLTERVVTLGTLKGRLDGISKVIVTNRAVITPAVKDELKQRGIHWARS